MAWDASNLGQFTGIASDERCMPRTKTNAADVHVGVQISMRRLEVGLSQADLGRKLGVSYQQIQKYEKGSDKIAASRLVKLSLALDVPVSHFFEGLKQGGQTGASVQISSDALTSRESQKLALVFNSIKSAELRRASANLVKIMAKADRAAG
jgi:transcriptional regulator with XRE-family HTH domain